MNKYYVYLHIDPRDDRIKYVGMGQGSRAWMMRNSGGPSPRYGHRSPEHYAWFEELEALGYTLDQIVVVEQRRLSKKEALRLEKEFVKECDGGQLFNKNRTKDWTKQNQEIISKVKSLRNASVSFKKIAEQLGIGVMTAWRMSYAG
jgi:hypothetical protein